MHGRPRKSAALDPARLKEEEAKIANLQAFLSDVLRNHREKNYSKTALQQSARLLEVNPEVYTAWNYRRLAVKSMMEPEVDDVARKAILEQELQVVERALARNFKCYGAWHHRKWIIEFGLSSLDREFQLLEKLLSADSRNFHGWDYRRFIVDVKKVTEEEELKYTLKKINENFSNYSAWHNRSALLSKQFSSKLFSEDKRQDILTKESKLVEQAFFTEPDDQSGWFYLMWLLGQTVPLVSASTDVKVWKDGSSCDVNQINSCSDFQAGGISCLKDSLSDTPIMWPTKISLQRIINTNNFLCDVEKKFTLESEERPCTTAEWQLETLESQIRTCRELLDLENESKWAKLTLARLLMAYDTVTSSLHGQKQHTDEVKQLFRDLIEVDPTHWHYYDEQLSLLLIDEITNNIHTLSGYWWEWQNLTNDHDGWLRFNNMSLSKLGNLKILSWLQRLDLSNNRLQSLEGIGSLPNLTCLDVSHNLLSSTTALGPMRSIQNLQVLNITYNKIGAHTIDTHRYLFPSFLNNTPDEELAECDGHPASSHLWEVIAMFRGMRLKQLDISGNPIVNDRAFEGKIIQALPVLVWLDGIRVGS